MILVHPVTYLWSGVKYYFSRAEIDSRTMSNSPNTLDIDPLLEPNVPCTKKVKLGKQIKNSAKQLCSTRKDILITFTEHLIWKIKFLINIIFVYIPPIFYLQVLWDTFWMKCILRGKLPNVLFRNSNIEYCILYYYMLNN